MSAGEVAGLIVAVFWAILVSVLAVVLVRLGRALKQTSELVAGVTERVVPLLGEATAALRSANSRLDRVDTITSDVPEVTADQEAAANQEATAHASALSSAATTAFGGPLVKIAAFGYGVRRAVGKQAEQGLPVARRTGRAGRRTVIVHNALPAARPSRRGNPSIQGKG